MPTRGLAKPADLEFLHRERFDDAHAANRLFENRGHIGHSLLRAVRRPPQPKAEVHHRPDEQRGDHEADERQLGIGNEDIEQQPDQGDRFLKQVAHPRRYRGLNGIGIGDQSADHFAGRALGKESVALIDDALVQLVAEIAHR